MPRRSRLSSVARSLISRQAQRNFSRTSRARTAQRMQQARDRINPISDRRYVRFSTPRRNTGRGQFTVQSRDDSGLNVGHYVGAGR